MKGKRSLTRKKSRDFLGQKPDVVRNRNTHFDVCYEYGVGLHSGHTHYHPASPIHTTALSSSAVHNGQVFLLSVILPSFNI